MNNFITTLHEIEVASTENAITVTDKFENINGREFIAKLNVAHDGDKTGSHWIRTALCLDKATKKCKPRNNENAESLARLLIIDGDCSIDANGKEVEGAPNPLQVSAILMANDIGHILYGSYSHYTGGKGNRYRILLTTKAPYNNEQLLPTAERVVSLINSGLAKLGFELLAYAKENGTWAQPWYYPRKPANSLISALYLEYLEGNTIDIMEPMELPAEGQSIRKNYQAKADEISPIHAFNEQKNLADALLHYGYKRVFSTKEYEKWLSPDSSSGVAGIVVKNNKFFSHHNDEFNDGHWHDVFDFMRVKRGITEHEAIIVAARNTRAPDGRSVDEYNKSLVKNKSMAAILSIPLIIPFETYQPFDDELLPVDAIPYLRYRHKN